MTKRKWSKEEIEELTSHLVCQSLFAQMSMRDKMKMKIHAYTDILPEHRTADLYPPRSQYEKEQLGIAILECIDFVRSKGLDMTVTYPKYSEYFVFPTVEAIWDYFVEFFEGIITAK